MTAAEAALVVARARSLIRAHVAPSEVRTEILTDLFATETALAQPASLCTRDELFDAVLCDEPDEEGSSPLILDLLDQLDTGALVAYLAARQAREERERAARLHSHPTHNTVPDPSEAP